MGAICVMILFDVHVYGRLDCKSPTVCPKWQCFGRKYGSVVSVGHSTTLQNQHRTAAACCNHLHIKCPQTDLDHSTVKKFNEGLLITALPW